MSYKLLDEGRFTPPFVPTLELSPWPEPAPNCSQPWKSGRNGHRTWPSLTRGERASCVRCAIFQCPPGKIIQGNQYISSDDEAIYESRHKIGSASGRERVCQYV